MSAEPDQRRYCLGCGYDLRRLPSNRCPECGAVFDPEQPQTYAVTPVRFGGGALVISLSLAVVYVGVVVIVSAVANYVDPWALVASTPYWPLIGIAFLIDPGVPIALGVWALAQLGHRRAQPHGVGLALATIGVFTSILTLLALVLTV
ncbi:MAG: hypothetical protein D6744_02075 [Planctomycetota bacterium]|nr:MAG: hypothetical protein D6744_02075 [Planctomycetota bacterium]